MQHTLAGQLSSHCKAAGLSESPGGMRSCAGDNCIRGAGKVAVHPGGEKTAEGDTRGAVFPAERETE